ncbi:iron-containing alcohol dehydrogenase [Shewanella sp. AS16]|uniref:iron-containing alcohol dehydrogenase n=1 Tax=Shewanella sp. AS16 TaxID=2907625 RepID=UPI001F251925|nr:iron-containing alcohol dehydrogenase [Shewanella sp. AS16]MCE9684697.1 iron-containing alcohol dehydrogenase [Shewanella sp. AS16]
MALQAEWNYPTAISVGAGVLRRLPEACRQLGMTQPLLVTDPGLAQQPMVSRALALCRAAGLEASVFSDIRGNPTADNVSLGMRVFRRGGFDGVIALGGGSSLDAGKTIAMMAAQSLSLWDAEDLGDNWTRLDTRLMAPVVAIPTTAGTGSEVGRAAVITDSARRLKRILFHPQMLPARVLLDPELTLGLPAHLSAATGMDALSHNLEAYCAPGYHPMAAGIALEAMRLIKLHLPRVVANGDDLEARTQMLVASCMGATAFQRGLGAMHALAHSLGALYDKHHGLLNAILMPYVLLANRSAIEAPMGRLARYLELPEPGFDACLQWLLDLRAELGIPHTLAEIGLGGEEAQRIGRMALADAAAAGNPIAFDAEQYADLFRDALTGSL